MSDKPKFDSDEAAPVACELVEILRPFCERIEIAGSLRRMKNRVGDIEILFVPRVEHRQADMFTTEPMDLADEKIGKMLADGTFSKRPNVNGSFAWGKKNKLAIHNASGIPVDLFSVPSEICPCVDLSTLPEGVQNKVRCPLCLGSGRYAPNWWVALVIRTGSKETNLKLTTGAQKKNATLNAYGSGITWSDGTKTDATSEQHVFELCGVEYLEPNCR